jgi:TonB family protein
MTKSVKYIITLFLLLPLLSFSQKVDNIHCEQEGKKINIYYDLDGKGTYNVKVYCSTNNGYTWGKPLQKVSGDVGESINPGKSKTIVWDVLEEQKKLEGNIKFKVDAEKIKQGPVLTKVESMPEFPGGLSAFMKYLQENIKYPDDAKDAGIQGRVYLNFIVEKNGSISNIKVIRGIGAGCDEEAVRVVKNMPKWKPGMSKGQPVRVSFNLPIKFSLTNN